MWKWDPYPAIRLLIPLISGITISLYLNTQDLIFLFWGVCILFLLSVLFGFLRTYRLRWIDGILFNSAITIAAILLSQTHYGFYKREHIHNLEGDTVSQFIGYVCSFPESTATGKIRLNMKVMAFGSDTFSKLSGNILVYLQHDTLESPIETGDLLILEGQLVKPEPPGNPGQFNYNRYLFHKGITRMLYVDEKSYMVLDADYALKLKRIAGQVRAGTLELIHTSPLSMRNKSLLSALLLGDKSEIESETYTMFASAGVIHILCVSGLHAGIIYLAISLILSPLDRLRNGRKIKYFAVAPVIWFYALITGLSPSVLRASTMISLILGGRILSRQPVSLNSIASSALILLIVNPFNLTNIGFQLSYLAVSGIILIQQPIYRLLSCRYTIPNKISALACLSVSAQLLTFPLSIYYFGRFPNYFLASNLLAVPLAGIIIHIGILYFLTAKLSLIGFGVGYLLEICMQILDKIVVLMNQLPGSSTSNISLTVPELLLIYPILFLLISLILNFSLKRSILLLGTLSAFLILNGIIQFYADKEGRIVVYDVRGYSATGFQHDGSHRIVSDSTLLLDTTAIDYNLRESWRYWNLGEPVWIINDQEDEYIMISNDYIFFRGITIAAIGRPYLLPAGNIPIHVDILILKDNTTIELGDLLEHFQFRYLVFDSSNSRWQIKKWKKAFNELGIIYHSVPDQGAMVFDF